MDFTTSPEFFINMKSIPDPSSKEYESFFQNELYKIEYGFTVNGVFIPGWLYWHCCHWKIFLDVVDPINQVVKRKLETPLFRDNDWIVAEYREKAIQEKKGLMIVGQRRSGKSEWECSIIGRSSTIYEGSENVISAGNDKDLKLLSDKIDKGLNNVHPYFRWGRIENDWKRQVTLGIKDKQGNRVPWSYILPRNLDDGQNTEAIAGITAKELVIDEGGKFKFLRCLEAAIPAFTSPYGWRCSPLIVCTGGSFEKGEDAEKLHLNPEAYNFLSVQAKDEAKKYSLFIPGTYRMEAKIETTLAGFLETKGISVPKESELWAINFQQSDEKKALEIIQQERETAKKANDQEAYLKAVMYYPITPEECFLTSSYNIFNVDAARAQRRKILSTGITGTPVFLYNDGEGIKFEFTDKKPIIDYPHKPSDDKDAPVVIWEHPIHNPPFGLYVCGVDSYKQGKSAYSDSLGAVYIFKRLHDIQSEKFQDMVVASYVARPDNKDKWEEQARLLIKYYNARTLVENDEISFIEYMKAKGDSYYLEKQPPWLRDIVETSKVSREYGIHRSAQKIRDHLHGLVKKYLDQVIKVERDEEGSVIREVLGVSQIYDAALLEEVIKFNDTDNFDREIAFSLALAMAAHLDPMGKVSTTEDDKRITSYFNNKRNNNIFSNLSTNMFGKRRRRLF